MAEMVCRECHRILKGQTCPICGTGNLSSDWSGMVIIIDPQKSEIAKKMGIESKDRYALKVR
ncbi:transcription elongation factor subunit Spt4 [Methanosalsum natronophilum]|uniref:Transcription elongation factor Spt4 n=1 Tax=Methanosalsum natronophilum TaxID=768733 RepID=A0A3R7YGN7_9EURY|nr:transcription elongation factor subunit Spt4 [Methanosalsum natronophilum]MCS3923045.1 DNA-directed RNA polymerase subunit E' [Methanosalsum natronophilum]RQD82687.1 MAG: DNA-directed RNA polymerase subunit E'' [Methanosalsum natronophilum]